ncbi:MAG TPA: SpoIID/LytB domain-containing protein, partial [bacterium]|nr:SpoIID/LytB domain-containing protein [bacterium]
YRLEGFDFTAMESCRAYNGVGGYTSATDQAVTATAGIALTYGEEFVKAVFSSCCGGWTENNENVWSGPPNPMLRGLSDLRPGAGSGTPSADHARWLSAASSAWCSGDADGYRWQRRYTTKEVSDLVNKKHRVGNVQSIREGTRGVSGRLKSITITGSAGSVTLDSELEIRQAFGGLPSAMVIIRPTLDRGAPVSFTFTGGGRGHGVGMCQHGARGMAGSGRRFEEIVAHYFPGATLERTER